MATVYEHNIKISNYKDGMLTHLDRDGDDKTQDEPNDPQSLCRVRCLDHCWRAGLAVSNEFSMRIERSVAIISLQLTVC